MSTVLVKLKMKSESDGGRHCPFTEGYSPHFVVSSSNAWLAVRSIDHKEEVHPGTVKDVKFELTYYPNIDYSALTAGIDFDVMEGGRSVARGIVLEREDS